MSVILRTVVTIRLKDGIEDISSVVVQRKRRSVLRLKRDSGSGSGYAVLYFGLHADFHSFVIQITLKRATNIFDFGFAL